MSNYKIQKNMVVMSADEFNRLMKDFESLQEQVKSLTAQLAELDLPTESERDEVEQARAERAEDRKTMPVIIASAYAINLHTGPQEKIQE